MERLCPLCRQMGLQNKISAYPLNEYEDIQMCENEMCTWPLGDKSFGFIPTENEILKEVAEKHNNLSVVPISTELSLDTPPVTPEKANTSNIAKSCEEQLGISENNFVGKYKFQPAALSSESVSSIKIFEKIPVRKLIMEKGKKPAMKKVNMSVVPSTKNVNYLNSPKNISDTNYKFGSTMKEIVPIDSTSNNITVDLPVILDNSYLTNVDSNSLDIDFITHEEIDLESNIEDLKSGNTNHQVNIDEEWLTSFLM